MLDRYYLQPVDDSYELMNVPLVSTQTVWDEGTEGNLAEKDLVDEKLNMTQLCTCSPGRQSCPGLHQNKCGQMREVILALL